MKGSQDAVTSTYAFIIAVGIMLGSVATVYSATNDIASQGTVLEAEQVNLQTEAANLKQIILGTPGVAGAGSWDESETPSADTLDRLGLLEPDLTGIQFEKLQNLRLAPREANDTDNFANYDEVAADLGLEGKGLDFHIRAKPTLKALEDVLNDESLRDQNLKVTYIGSAKEVKKDSGGDDVPIDEGLTVDNLACDESPTGGPSYRFSVDITNGGDTPTQFFVVFEIDAGTELTREDQTDIVASGATTTAFVDVEYVSGFSCNEETEVGLSILDPVQQLQSTQIIGPAVGDNPSSSTDDQFYMETEERYFLTTDDIRLDYYGDEEKNDGLTLAVRPGTDPAATSSYDLTDTVPNGGGQRYLEIPAGTLAAGEYTAYLTHAPSGVIATQRIIVVAAGNEPEAYTPSAATGSSGEYVMDPAVAIEVGFLDDLIQQFCPTYYYGKVDSPISTDWNTRCSFKSDTDPALLASQPGDVFPSVTKPSLEELMERLVVDTSGNPNDWLPRYDIVDTLIVGSNVPQQAMNGGQFGKALQTWVHGGGTLIVFGSPEGNINWMNDVFKVKGDSSSGGINAPDVSHPLLSIPESLAYDEYATEQEGWQYTGNNQDQFTDVVKQGDTPVTAISDPGDFGEGTIIITTWRPYDLFGTGESSDEGMRVFYNFLSQSYRDLFLDYGPPIPDGVPVIPAFGLSQVDHPDLGRVTLTVTFFVFPSSG